MSKNTGKEQGVKSFKNQIKDYIEEKINDDGVEWGKNNQLQGYYFAEWIAEKIVDTYGGYSLFGDIPQSRDGGIDFVLEDSENKRAIIGQTKLIRITQTKTNNADRESIARHFDLHRTIMDKSIFENATDSVLKNLEDYSTWIKNGWTIKYLFITTDKNPLTKLKDQETTDKATIEYEVWDIYSLKDFFYKSDQLSATPPEEVSFKLKKDKSFIKEPIRSQNNVGDTLIGIIGGNELSALYRDYADALFAYNIRQFLGKPQNKKIIGTAQERGDEFFYFNNGVTAICSDFKVNKNEITARNFQIINGAQTVVSIRNATLQQENKVKDVEVLIRIVETGELKTTQKGFNKDIVTFNNTQNKIETWDFISNDPIQIWLEQNLFEKNIQVGQKFYYERKRTSEKIRGSHRLKPEDLAKCIYSFTYDDFHPNVPYGEGKTRLVQNSEDSKDGLYDELFCTSDAKWTKSYLNNAKVGIQLMYTLIDYFKTFSKSDIENEKNIYNVRNLRFLHLALFKHIIETQDISLNKLGKSKKDLIEFFDDWVEIVVKATVKAVKDYERLNPLRNANRNVSRDLVSFQLMVEYIDDLLLTAPKINK